MRIFSLLFALIALVVLAQLVLYVVRGPVDPIFVTVLAAGFLACVAPALYLLKPFESREALRRRREERRRRREGRGS